MPQTKLDFNQVEDDLFASQSELELFFPYFTLVDDAESFTDGANNQFIRVKETNTIYKFESNGGDLTRDGLLILNTGSGGNTRWVAVSGDYSIYITEQGLNEIDAGFSSAYFQFSLEEADGGDANGD